MTFRDNFQIHKKYENFYPTLELLHDQYYFPNILFAKHRNLNETN